MYTRHYVYLCIIAMISSCTFTSVISNKFIPKISVIEINYIVTILSTITGFTMTSLSILLSAKSAELNKKDIRKRNNREIEVILSYYQFNIAISLITIIVALLNIYPILSSVMFIVSIYSAYLCLKILISIFTR